MTMIRWSQRKESRRQAELWKRRPMWYKSPLKPSRSYQKLLEDVVLNLSKRCFWPEPITQLPHRPELCELFWPPIFTHPGWQISLSCATSKHWTASQPSTTPPSSSPCPSGFLPSSSFSFYLSYFSGIFLLDVSFPPVWLRWVRASFEVVSVCRRTFVFICEAFYREERYLLRERTTSTILLKSENTHF